VSIPDTLHGVIMARVDRLDEDLKQVLRLASVIGRTFLYPVLRGISEVELALEDCLGELQAHELVLEKTRQPELEYIFKHALVQEATYESILLQRRRDLHSRVARTVEALFADRLEEFYGLLAHHYSQAEDWEKAQEYLFKAADQAGRISADAEALAHYERALGAYSQAFGDRWDPLERAVLERKIGEAFWRRGDHEQAERHCRTALELLGRPLPRTRARLVGQILREVLGQVWHRLRRLSPSAGWGVDAPPPIEEQARLCVALIWITVVNHPEMFLLLALRLINLAERERNLPALVPGASALGTAADVFGLPQLAAGYHQRAVRAAELSGSPQALALALQNLTFHELGTGEEQAAAEHARRATALYDSAGDLKGWGTARYQQALVQLRAGDLVEAEALARETMGTFEDGVDGWARWMQGEVLGSALTSRGSYAQAREVLYQTLEHAQRAPNHGLILRVSAPLAASYRLEGDLGHAREVLDAGGAVRQQHGIRWPLQTGPLQCEVVAVLLAEYESKSENRRPEALREAGEACVRAVKIAKKYRPVMPRALRWRGTYEWLRGDERAALSSWESSAREAAARGWRYELALTEIERGLRLADEEALRRGHALAVQMGAVREAARAEEALSHLS
jgi:tetratricopeptide (TPR) repeat protein